MTAVQTPNLAAFRDERRRGDWISAVGAEGDPELPSYEEVERIVSLSPAAPAYSEADSGVGRV